MAVAVALSLWTRGRGRGRDKRWWQGQRSGRPPHTFQQTPTGLHALAARGQGTDEARRGVATGMRVQDGHLMVASVAVGGGDQSAQPLVLLHTHAPVDWEHVGSAGGWWTIEQN